MRLIKRSVATTVNALAAIDDTINTVSKVANAAYVGASTLVIAAEAGEFYVLELAVDGTRDRVKKLTKRLRKLEAIEEQTSSVKKAITGLNKLITDLTTIEYDNINRLEELRSQAITSKLKAKSKT